MQNIDLRDFTSTNGQKTLAPGNRNWPIIGDRRRDVSPGGRREIESAKYQNADDLVTPRRRSLLNAVATAFLIEEMCEAKTVSQKRANITRSMDCAQHVSTGKCNVDVQCALIWGTMLHFVHYGSYARTAIRLVVSAELTVRGRPRDDGRSPSAAL